MTLPLPKKHKRWCYNFISRIIDTKNTESPVSRLYHTHSQRIYTISTCSLPHIEMMCCIPRLIPHHPKSRITTIKGGFKAYHKPYRIKTNNRSQYKNSYSPSFLICMISFHWTESTLWKNYFSLPKIWNFWVININLAEGSARFSDSWK